MDAQAITCVPDVTRRERDPEDNFVLIACDGVWDVLSSAEGANYIREVGEERKEEDEAHRLLEALFEDIIAEDIDDQSEQVGGSDNMSAILIEFKSTSTKSPRTN